MAETPRRNANELPMFTRASDLKVDCWAQWFLSHRYTEELPDAGFFHLGTAAHFAFEQTILGDLTLDEAKAVAQVEAESLIDASGGTDKMIWSKRRNAKTFDKDLDMLVENFFDQVHPDSPNRMPIYNRYEWPPRVEIKIEADYSNGVVTTADAVFKHRSHGQHAVVDWKTGATAKSAPIQLWTYKWGLEQMGEQVYKGWFHHVAQGKLQEPDFWPPNEYIEWLIQSVEKLKEDRLFVPKPDWYCDYCRAQTLCPLQGGELGWDDMIESIKEAESMYDPV